MLYLTYVSGIQNNPNIKTPYPIPENIQNVVDSPTFASMLGLNLPAKKNEVTAIEVAKPEPISLALDGSNSDWNIHMHAINPALSPEIYYIHEFDTRYSSDFILKTATKES